MQISLLNLNELVTALGKPGRHFVCLQPVQLHVIKLLWFVIALFGIYREALN